MGNDNEKDRPGIPAEEPSGEISDQDLDPVAGGAILLENTLQPVTVGVAPSLAALEPIEKTLLNKVGGIKP